MRLMDPPKLLISHKLRWVYHRIPKTGSSSMIQYIKNMDPDAEYIRTHKKYKGYYHFTVVHDDIMRMVSIWKAVCFQNKMPEEWKVKHPWIKPRMRFIDFATKAMTHDDPHWRPCHKFLKPGMKVYQLSDITNWDNFPRVNKSADYTLPSWSDDPTLYNEILFDQILKWAKPPAVKKKRFNLGFFSFWFDRVKNRAAVFNTAMLASLFLTQNPWQLWYLYVLVIFGGYLILDGTVILKQERDYAVTRSQTIKDIHKAVSGGKNV